MAATAGHKYPDYETIMAIFGDPYNLPGAEFRPKVLNGLRVLDEENAVGRYRWYNLPNGLTGELIERVLYYKGTGCFFYVESKKQFYFLPYVLNGGIDVYGQYEKISPLPFTGKSEVDKKVFIPGLVLKPLRDVILDDEESIDEDFDENNAVILYDYVKQYSQIITPRKDLQEPILGFLADCLPMARTALICNSGIKGIKVSDPDQAPIVKAASDATYISAITGSPWVPIGSQVDMEDLTSAGTALRSEEFLLMMQGVDNYRLSLYGLKNGGLFQKKAHMLEAEAEMNDGNVGIVYNDGLLRRQQFCDIINSRWNLGVWCDASESVVGTDRNGDMMVGDTEDQSGEYQGSQPEMSEVSNDK